MIVAAFDRDDDDHTACALLLTGLREQRVVPAPVLVEVDHLLRRYTGDESFGAVLDQVRSGALVVEDLATGDYERAGELMRTYAEAPRRRCAVVAASRLSAPRSRPPPPAAVTPPRAK